MIVKVACYGTGKTLDYEYVHALIHRKEKLKERGPDEKRHNVLIMVFDSMSASSFKQALPNSYQYLKSFANFHSFEKFHTVGENALPNLVTILSGLNAEKLLGDVDFPGLFDDFPFIWKELNQK